MTDTRLKAGTQVAFGTPPIKATVQRKSGTWLVVRLACGVEMRVKPHACWTQNPNGTWSLR